MSSVERFGVTFSWRGAKIEGVRKLALEADRLGFGYFWVPEAWGLDAVSVVAHLLSLTKNMVIAPGVLNVYSRSAALIGMTCVSLSQISPGRFVLGLGASGRGLVTGWHGIPFEQPLNRTKRYVEIIRTISSGAKYGAGPDARFRIYTKAPTEPLRIYLGALGPKNLELAGDIAEGALLAHYPMSALSRAKELAKGKTIFAYYPLVVVDSEEEEKKARLQVARNISFYVASMGRYYARNLSELGFEKSVNKIINTYKESGGPAAAYVLDDALIDELSLIGRVDAVAETVPKYFNNDIIPVFALNVATDEEVSQSIASLRRVAV